MSQFVQLSDIQFNTHKNAQKYPTVSPSKKSDIVLSKSRLLNQPILLPPTGVEIVKKALRIPCYTIANNAGVDAQEVVTKVQQGADGYDAMNDAYVDMMKTGIIDPTKVRNGVFPKGFKPKKRSNHSPE